MFVIGKDILVFVCVGKYVVGVFNINNMEIIQVIIYMVEKLCLFVIVQMSEGVIKYGGQDFVNIVIDFVICVIVFVVLYFDYGFFYELVFNVIKMGFILVMIDVLYYFFEENVYEIKCVVEVVYVMGISVEVEFGCFGGIEEYVVVDEKDVFLIDFDEVVKFVEEIGIDYFVIVIGISYGVYKGKGCLFIDQVCIKKIGELFSILFVVYGFSGVLVEIVQCLCVVGGEIGDVVGIVDEDLIEVVQYGIVKVNVDIDLCFVSIVGICEVFKVIFKEFDFCKIFGLVCDVMSQIVEYKMGVFGSVGKV